MDLNLGTISLSPNILTKSNIGLWAFELDENCKPRMYVNNTMLELLGLTKQISPEDTYHAWYDNIDSSSYELVEKTVKKMKAGEHAEVQYPWKHPNGQIMYVRFGGTRNFSYTKGIRIEGYHQNVSEIVHYQQESIEKTKKLSSYNTILDSISEDYETILNIDLATGEQIVFKNLDEKAAPYSLDGLNFFETINKYVINHIVEEDKKRFKESIKPELIAAKISTGEPHFVNYKDNHHKKIRWMQLKFIKNINDINKNSCIVSFRNVTQDHLEEEKKIEENAVISGLAEDFNHVTYIDLINETDTVYKNTSKFFKNKKIKNLNYKERLKYYVDNYVYSEDKEKFINNTSQDTIIPNVKKGNPYYVNFRIVDNNEIHYEQIKYVPHIQDGKLVGIVSGYHNVDIEHKKMIESEQIHTTLSKIAESFMVVIYADLTRDFIRTCFVSKEIKRKFKNLNADDNTKYTKSVYSYLSKYASDEDSDRLKLLASPKYIAEQFKTKNSFSFNFTDIYETNRKTYSIEFIKANKEGTAAIICGSDITEIINQTKQTKEMEAQLENYSIISSLASDFEYVAYIDSTKNEMITYRESKEFLEIENSFNPNLESKYKFDLLLKKVVYEKDFESFLKYTNRKLVLKALKQSHSYQFDTRFLINGKIKVFRTKFSRASDKTNNVVIGIFDIDKQIRTESENLSIISALSDNFAYVGIIDVNETSIKTIHSTESSKKFLNILNKKNNNFIEIRNKIALLIHPDDIKSFLENARPSRILAALRKEGTYKLDTRFIINGKERYYRIKFTNTDKNSKNIVIGFLDVDEQVRKEMAKGEAVGLKRAQSFADAFLKSYVSAYYINLKDGSLIVYHQDDYLKIDYNSSKNYLTPLIAYINKNVYEEDRKKMLEAVLPLYIKKRLKTEEKFSVYMRDISGSRIKWLRFDVNRGIDADHAGISFTDVSDKMEEDEKIRFQMETQQKELESALIMAQSANRAKTTFLNNMSHDIRTPMNAIIGFTKLADSHINNKTQVKDYLKKIQQSSDHLLSLINDILDMSRIESGKMNFVNREENLTNIIHSLKNIVVADIHAKQLSFYIDTVDIKNETIFCDKLRLNQVLLNLLSNAIKYTPTGGNISLRITQKRSNVPEIGKYEFRVKDNGIGMTPEFLKIIFEPFTRESTATVSGIQGTGLGMAITKNIVDMMGGTIEVESEKDNGTEFILTLDFKITENKGIDPKAFSMLEKARALVIDDDMNSCMSISKMLKDYGIVSEWCTSGKESVVRTEEALAENNPYKLYIIDWLMPDINGIELTRRIKSISKDKNIIIIILTVYDWSDIEEEGKTAGVTSFASKPLFPSDLQRILLNTTDEIQKKDETQKKLKEDFKNKKVLIVDDNEFNREIAIEFLKEYNFNVDYAENGKTAIEKIKKNENKPYDLILMDIQMPIMDGYEATKAIRKLDSAILKSIPIIAMTANAFDEDKKLALDSGMNDHISKPIDNEKLIKTLSKFLLN